MSEEEDSKKSKNSSSDEYERRPIKSSKTKNKYKVNKKGDNKKETEEDFSETKKSKNKKKEKYSDSKEESEESSERDIKHIKKEKYNRKKKESSDKNKKNKKVKKSRDISSDKNSDKKEESSDDNSEKKEKYRKKNKKPKKEEKHKKESDSSSEENKEKKLKKEPKKLDKKSRKKEKYKNNSSEEESENEEEKEKEKGKNYHNHKINEIEKYSSKSKIKKDKIEENIYESKEESMDSQNENNMDDGNEQDQKENSLKNDKDKENNSNKEIKEENQENIKIKEKNEFKNNILTNEENISKGENEIQNRKDSEKIEQEAEINDVKENSSKILEKEEKSNDDDIIDKNNLKREIKKRGKKNNKKFEFFNGNKNNKSKIIKEKNGENEKNNKSKIKSHKKKKNESQSENEDSENDSSDEEDNYKDKKSKKYKSIKKNDEIISDAKKRKYRYDKSKKSKHKNDTESEDDNLSEEKNKKRHKKEKHKKHKKDNSESTSNEEENESSSDHRKKNKTKRYKKSYEHKKKYSDDSEEDSDSEDERNRKYKTHNKNKTKRKEKYREINEENDISSSDEDNYIKERKKRKEKNKSKNDKKYYDNYSSDNENKKTKEYKKRKKKNKNDYSESFSDSNSYSDKKREKHKKKNKKKEKYISDSDSESDKKHKNRRKNQHKKRKQSSSDSNESEERKSRFSSEESNSDSSDKKNNNKYKDKYRGKSSMNYEEKQKKEKKKKIPLSSSSSSENEEKEIIKNLKETKLNEVQPDLDNSDSDSKDENVEQPNKINITNNNITLEERKEDNVKVHKKIIEENKTSLEKLKPKNQSGKFLMAEQNKNKNKEEQKQVQKIINNFMKADSVIVKYITEFKSDDKKKAFFKKQGFILTEKSMERMALLIHYILNGVPVLFEGNTGTAKTRTTLTACNYIKKFIKKDGSMKLIRYNLSAETKIDDIIAKYVSDQKSFIGLSVQNGPFVDAYVNGKIILFDEINLAPSNVLQCIQQSLDNGFLSVETNGRCLLKYEKHPNFAFVATQNPNKDAFEGKRQELGPEFLSRFQKIYFPDILKDEMEEIALGIARNVGYLKSGDKDEKDKIKFLKDIVNLHYEWATETESQTEIQCFTIREIESVIQCLANNESPNEVIMTIYGGRFREDKKEKLKLKLNRIEYLKYQNPEKESLPENFPNCYSNSALIYTVKSVLLALRNKRNVIIVGNNESGLTQVAEWCSYYFNKYLTAAKTEKTFICFCTRNLECSDLIGTQKISNSDNNSELIQFEPRFLYNAIREGNCVVLDSINEAPSRVIERLNGLLDKKNSEKEEVFEVPENTKEPVININKDFRIICTSNFDKINQISPAFVNRFEVIVLENQLKYLTENKNKMKNLIQLLCNKYQQECHDNYKKRRKKIKLSEKIRLEKEREKNKIIDDPFGDDIKEEEEKIKNKIKIDKTIEINDDLMNQIIEKINILSDGKNPNEQTLDDSIPISSKENEVDENSKKYLTMSSITKFCRTIVILINKFKLQKDITSQSIINFSFELLFEEHLSSANKEIQDYLIEELIQASNKIQDLGEEQYFFDKSESLKKLMIQIYACSLINQYLCIVGPPGIGKTIGARAFSYMREIIFGIIYESPFYMHTFNQFTRPSDYYGISSLKDEK